MKDLRLAGISNMKEGNAFLPGFTERFNAKFAKAPRRADNLHRLMNIEPDRLRDIFCFPSLSADCYVIACRAMDERLVSKQDEKAFQSLNPSSTRISTSHMQPSLRTSASVLCWSISKPNRIKRLLKNAAPESSTRDTNQSVSTTHKVGVQSWPREQKNRRKLRRRLQNSNARMVGPGWDI